MARWHLLVVLTLAAAATCGLSARQSSVAAAATLDRFLATDEPLTSYEGTRCLAAVNERLNLEATLLARVTLSPARGFEWQAIAERGSGHIRQKVLREALERERELVASGAAARGALTPANYELTPRADAAPPATAVVQLTPRRRDGLLVDGSLLLTDPEGDLLEVRGRLARNPSWWTTRVDIVRRYARVAGVRVPVETRSTASVRIVGQSHFRMVSVYKIVNGHRPGQVDTLGDCAVTPDLRRAAIERATPASPR